MRRIFTEKIGRYWPLLAIPFFFFAALLLFQPKEESPLEERGLQIRQIDDPEGTEGEMVVVAPEKVPQTMRDRQEAPSIALLPHRTGYPEMQGEKTLPPGEAEEIKNFAGEFLRIWETYKTGDRSYKQRLLPFVEKESLLSIASRVDSADQPDVCPENGCTKGSVWYDSKNFADSAFLVDWQEPFVYLVAYGAISYEQAGEPHGSTERAYGLIMRKSDSGWVVERVAAESLR